jgi:hypothetical protein
MMKMMLGLVDPVLVPFGGLSKETDINQANITVKHRMALGEKPE